MGCLISNFLKVKVFPERISDKMNHFLELKNVSKTIDGRVIIKPFHAVLEGGKVYGFVGENGSGKTMLFRLMGQLVPPTTGELLYDGFRVGKKNQPNIGVIIEHASLFPDMTGFENLEYLAGFRKRITKHEICEAIKRVGLDPADKRVFRKYSLGMKQRLLLAQAIMEKPDYLILDEAGNGLDKDGQVLLHDIIREEAERGAVVIIASHISWDISTLCDSVFYVDQGEIKEGAADGDETDKRQQTD